MWLRVGGCGWLWVVVGGCGCVVAGDVWMTVRQTAADAAIGGRGEKQATKRAESGLLVPTGQDATHQCTAHTGMHLPVPGAATLPQLTMVLGDAVPRSDSSIRTACCCCWLAGWLAGLCGGGMDFCTTVGISSCRAQPTAARGHHITAGGCGLYGWTILRICME